MLIMIWLSAVCGRKIFRPYKCVWRGDAKNGMQDENNHPFGLAF